MLPYKHGVFLCLLLTSLMHAQPVAFPGAEGFGRYASGGRGGEVLFVTTLSDSGPGSLREAIEANGPRTIVFRTSGTIFLEKPLVIRNGDLTIAGQTAPGQGITVAGRGLIIRGAENIIIRFIRCRLGDRYPTRSNLEFFEEDAFACGKSVNVMVDHCSFSWGTDETASTYNNRDFTMQWCIISESLNNSFHRKGSHGFGGIWGGKSASFHHNLLAHHRSRLPRFQGARSADFAEWGDDVVDFRHNLIYNWGDNHVYGGEPSRNGTPAKYNMVANVFRPGPASRKSSRQRLVTPYPGTGGGYSHFHLAGNTIEGAPEVSGDNLLGINLDTAGEKEAAFHAEPFPVPPVSGGSAEETVAQILAHAGASVPQRDPVDTRLVDEVRSGTASSGAAGLLDSQEQVGGYPSLAGAAPPVDHDRDGMPDDWELQNGLDPDDPSDRNDDPDGDGLTRLEDYLNSLVNRS